MRRKFNITGSCNPKGHYMVRLDGRLEKIKEEYVDEGSYFVINRGRQYGKTTTLKELKKYLKEDYIALSMDFQKLGTEEFSDEATFSYAFAEAFMMAFKISSRDDEMELPAPLAELPLKKGYRLKDLFRILSEVCAEVPKPIVLMIDEVDSASNNRIFIEFLAQLRAYYLERDVTPTFHSVILAGVYDVKNLKLKLRPESEHQYNSPWNVAVDFDIEMSFSVDQIASMLEEYETDYHTGMDIPAVSDEIYQYTSGYPVLVSSICKRIDEKICGRAGFAEPGSAWSKEGVGEAVKMILIDRAPLFESMIKHLDEFPEMKRMFQSILFQGREFSYSPDTKEISLACMFGYTVNKGGKVQIANRIFETRLYNYFLSEEELSNAMRDMSQRSKNAVIRDGRLDMEMALQKFVECFNELYGDNDEKFVETYGRKFFLLFLRPIINGTGNYYIEAQTRDFRRTDVIVDYTGEQFIVELKIWHGNEYNERGEAQLIDYLEYYHKDKGYMLSFNFNKKKETGVKVIKVGEKTIIEAVV